MMCEVERNPETTSGRIVGVKDAAAFFAVEKWLGLDLYWLLD